MSGKTACVIRNVPVRFVSSPVPVFLGAFDNLAADTKTGVVDENVDATETFLYVRDQLHDIHFLANIAGRRRAAGRGDDVDAFGGERGRDGLANAAGGAGNDGGLAVQRFHARESIQAARRSQELLR